MMLGDLLIYFFKIAARKAGVEMKTCMFYIYSYNTYSSYKCSPSTKSVPIRVKT